MSNIALIDTNILDCLLAAWLQGQTPMTTDAALTAEQVATLRLSSVGRLRGRASRDARGREYPRRGETESAPLHQQYPLTEVWVQEEFDTLWTARAAELGEYHTGVLHCQLVAEAEIIGVSLLLSFDKTLVRRLRTHTTVRLLFPTEHWVELAIPRGTPPTWTPAPSNPLARATFWRWD